MSKAAGGKQPKTPSKKAAKTPPKKQAKASPRKQPKAPPEKRSSAQRSIIPPGQVDTPQRRRDIMVAASELFAAHGYHGVSVRDIARRANVPIALCSYYFGKKQELFLALFEQNRSSIEDRIGAIEEVSRNLDTPSSLERLVRSWAEPIALQQNMSGDEVFHILTARALWDPAEEAQAAVEQYFDPVAKAFIRTLGAILPNRKPEDLVWGYEWAVGALLMFVMDRRIKRLSANLAVPADRTQIDNFVRFVCAGLRALPASGRRV